jgi:hypothetical protein
MTYLHLVQMLREHEAVTLYPPTLFNKVHLKSSVSFSINLIGELLCTV